MEVKDMNLVFRFVFDEPTSAVLSLECFSGFIS